MRNFSAYFKGGIYHEVLPKPVSGHLLVCTNMSFSQKATVLSVVQAFSGRKGVVSQDYFHVQ